MARELRSTLAAILIACTAVPAARADEPPQSPAPEAAAEEAAPVPGDVSGDTVLMVVDGTPITLAEVIATRRTLSAEYQRFPDEVLLRALLEKITDQQILANAAKAAGIDQTASVRLALRNQERAVLARAYLNTAIAERVTEAEVRAIYDERFVNAEPVEEALAAHILVESEEAAADLKAQLDAGGDFAALAGQHSLHTSANRGGDLGWFDRASYAPAFTEAVFALTDGEISGPVETPYGWHVIRLDGLRERPVPPIDEVAAEIIAALRNQAEQEILGELRAGATIESPETDVPPAAVRDDRLLAD